jgi:hypothetical protein
VYFGFHSRHDLWFLVLAAASLTFRVPTNAASEPWPWWPALVAVLIVIPLAVLVARQRGLTEEGLRNHLADDFPVRALEALKEGKYAGPIYHSVDWGGYLLYHIPELPALIDGRGNLHGGKRLKRVIDTCNASPDWTTDADLAAARVVLLSPRLPLAAVLRLDPRFRIAHQDRTAILFVRQDAGR